MKSGYVENYVCSAGYIIFASSNFQVILADSAVISQFPLEIVFGIHVGIHMRMHTDKLYGLINKNIKKLIIKSTKLINESIADLVIEEYLKCTLPKMFLLIKTVRIQL